MWIPGIKKQKHNLGDSKMYVSAFYSSCAMTPYKSNKSKLDALPYFNLRNID